MSTDRASFSNPRIWYFLHQHRYAQVHWFADGTFYVSPSEYTQLYTIHIFSGKFRNHSMHFFTPEEQVTGRLCVDAKCSLR